MPSDDDFVTFILPDKAGEWAEHTMELAKLSSVVVLRHIKQWFPDLSGWNVFFTALRLGDPDAVAAAVWAYKRHANVNPNPEPTRASDLPIGKAFLQPNRDPKAKPLLRWRFSVDGEELVVDFDTTLTIDIARKIKRRFPELLTTVNPATGQGQPGGIQAFWGHVLQGDPDAVCCAIWAARTQAGYGADPERNPYPWNMPDYELIEIASLPNVSTINEWQESMAEPEEADPWSTEPAPAAEDAESPLVDDQETP